MSSIGQPSLRVNPKTAIEKFFQNFSTGNAVFGVNARIWTIFTACNIPTRWGLFPHDPA